MQESNSIFKCILGQKKFPVQKVFGPKKNKGQNNFGTETTTDRISETVKNQSYTLLRPALSAADKGICQFTYFLGVFHACFRNLAFLMTTLPSFFSRRKVLEAPSSATRFSVMTRCMFQRFERWSCMTTLSLGS